MYESPLNYSDMPNPLAPEVWMSYEGNLYQVYTAVAMGTLSVVLWDILSCLPDELRLLSQCRFNLPTLCYYIARIAPVFFLCIHNTLLTHDANNCRHWSSLQTGLFAFIHITAGLLFLFRVRAVYNDLPRFKFFISAIWVAYAGCCFLSTFGVVGDRAVPLRRCVQITKRPYLAYMFFGQAGYDILLCASVTYKITRDVAAENRELKLWWSLRIRNNLYTRLRARFLSDSHAYFLLTFLIKITEITVYFAGTPGVLFIICLLDVVLISLIACKIYRRFRLGESGILNSSYETTTVRIFDTSGSRS